MKPLPSPRRQRATTPRTPLPGLSPGTLACLSLAQISVRTQAVADRAAARQRRATVQRLAERVAAVPKPKPKPKLRRRPPPPPAPAPARPVRPVEPEYTTAQADLLMRFTDAYDAGQPVHVGFTPDEVAAIYAHGARLRAKRQTF